VTTLYNGAGHPLELGPALGRGGEGAVHEIAGRPGFVAKVYHQPIGADKALKLDNMARQAHPALLEIAAWPVDVLRARPDGPVQGFVMPRVNGYREIHSLYGPSHRKKTFPHADWSFLVHAARNLASAFEAIHARSHVIGDVNPGNVVVSPQALVKLIDCDSFQISAGGQLFPCDVGVPQFTAPELQGQSFHGLRRTPDHDAFGLALLCFHLLFMGRHPFAGRYQGKGDMPIERAIREYRFAFGRHAITRQMEPPPHTLLFAALPVAVADLFERAFAPPKLTQGRPSARDWLRALEQLGAELHACGRNGAHKYPRSLRDCPWCALEQTSGTVFFVLPERSLAADLVGAGSPDFDLDQVWSRIQAAAPPDDEAMPAPAPRTPIVPTPLPDPLRRVQRGNALKAAAIIGAALVAIFIQWRLSWLWLPLAAAAWSLLRDGAVHREVQRRRLALFAARQELTDVRAAWNQRATGQPFAARLRDLRDLRDRHRNLTAALQQDLQRLETDQRQIQLRAFLESHFIDAAQIPGILTTDRMALESYGIETAADVTAEALNAVPGFGQRLGRQRAAALLAWRQDLERRFRHDPRQGPDPTAIANLRRQYIQERLRIERELLAAPDELAKIKTDILKQRAQLNIALIHQAMREAQAQADLRVFPPGLDTLWRRRRG
jgi:DNA-binding helix-hairpin-helix protein with protein kinase domain